MRGGRRRGPAKRAPKDIFSPGAKKEQKKTVVTPPPRNQPISPPIAITPPKVAGTKVEKKAIEKPKEKIIKPKSPDIKLDKKEELIDDIKIKKDSSKEIISDQIFGNKPKKTRGLKQLEKKEDKKSKELNVQSDRAAALIEQSRQRAMQPVVSETIIEKQPVKPAITKKRKNTKTSYQPAARAKRLNRSRHMEYKYEMRKLLDDINVPEEHRSNLLGTIWAKGERKTTSDAKDFLLEKMSEGAINEEQKSRLEKVIDDYTIRR